MGHYLAGFESLRQPPCFSLAREFPPLPPPDLYGTMPTIRVEEGSPLYYFSCMKLVIGRRGGSGIPHPPTPGEWVPPTTLLLTEDQQAVGALFLKKSIFSPPRQKPETGRGPGPRSPPSPPTPPLRGGGLIQNPRPHRVPLTSIIALRPPDGREAVLCGRPPLRGRSARMPRKAPPRTPLSWPPPLIPAPRIHVLPSFHASASF